MSATSWILPSISDEQSARKASRQGVWACGFVTLSTTLLVVLSHLGWSPHQVSLWALLDAVIFAGVGWGIYRVSRVAAIGGLLLFVLEKVSLWIDNGIPPNALSLAVVLAFINAIRGTVAFHGYAVRSESPENGRPRVSSEAHNDGSPIENEEYSCGACGSRVVLGNTTCHSCGEHLEFT